MEALPFIQKHETLVFNTMIQKWMEKSLPYIQKMHEKCHNIPFPICQSITTLTKDQKKLIILGNLDVCKHLN
jgi:hypothetical protein